jgi:hypothetical protein
MTNARRITVAVVLGVVLLAVVMTLTLPTQFGLLTARAQYADSAETTCGGKVSFQIRLFGDTQTYLDADLTINGPAITTTGKLLQKYLVCDSSLVEDTKSIGIAYFGKKLYIPVSAGAIVPRYFRDDQ